MIVPGCPIGTRKFQPDQVTQIAANRQTTFLSESLQVPQFIRFDSGCDGHHPVFTEHWSSVHIVFSVLTW
jgi:hypothetical protein